MSSQKHSKITETDLGYLSSDHDDTKKNPLGDDALEENAGLASGTNQAGTSDTTAAEKKGTSEDIEALSYLEDESTSHNNLGAFGSSEPGTAKLNVSDDNDCKKESTEPNHDATSPESRHPEVLPESAGSDGTFYTANGQENAASHDTGGMSETEMKYTDQKAKKRRYESPGPSSNRKLLKEIVAEAGRRRRHSIQETSPLYHEAEVEQSSNHVADSLAIDHSLLTDTGDQAVGADNSIPVHKKKVAEQSCRQMGYDDEQIEHAAQEFLQQHGLTAVYSGREIAELIMKREDEVKEEPPDELSPPPGIQHQTDDPGRSQYITTATVRDKGHPRDESSHHNIIIDVPLKNCGCCDSFDKRNITCRFFYS